MSIGFFFTGNKIGSEPNFFEFELGGEEEAALRTFSMSEEEDSKAS